MGCIHNHQTWWLSVRQTCCCLQSYPILCSHIDCDPSSWQIAQHFLITTHSNGTVNVGRPRRRWRLRIQRWGSCRWLRTVKSKVGRRNGTVTCTDPIFRFSPLYILSFYFLDYFPLVWLQSHFCLGISCITIKEFISKLWRIISGHMSSQNAL